MFLLKSAWDNIKFHKKRSILSILLITIASAAILLYRGFVEYSEQGCCAATARSRGFAPNIPSCPPPSVSTRTWCTCPRSPHPPGGPTCRTPPPGRGPGNSGSPVSPATSTRTGVAPPIPG